ncbi:hypothetical protein [Calidithermus roseus]|uniref:Uncharacterized protein n=1 Tax=Calidithermus roseus TaxID=1644118 RepID=A0A399ENG3_9DEIN|nr:hypothetical protein [Calidithermus roseus]RIH85425.1 hypothetical protein Mrose_02206 [Calidithermus roseus]
MHELNSRMEDLEQLAALALAHPQATTRAKALIREALSETWSLALLALHFEDPHWIAEASQSAAGPIEQLEQFFRQFAIPA